MAGETPITVVGNLTADPELRFIPSGAAVCNFTIASTPRTFDRQANEFKDGETLFMRCSVWREAAENVAASLHRGDRVVATGRLVARSWQTQEGENRTVMEMQAEEVGPSLKNATATVVKAQRQDGQQGGQGNAWGPSQGGQQGTPQADPWATPPGGQQAAQPGAQPSQQGGSQPPAQPGAQPSAPGGQGGGQWGGYNDPQGPPF